MFFYFCNKTVKKRVALVVICAVGQIFFKNLVKQILYFMIGVFINKRLCKGTTVNTVKVYCNHVCIFYNFGCIVGVFGCKGNTTFFRNKCLLVYIDFYFARLSIALAIRMPTS